MDSANAGCVRKGQTIDVREWWAAQPEYDRFECVVKGDVGGVCFKETFLSPHSCYERYWRVNRSHFVVGVHMDNEKSQHTLWLKMAGVHWAHYFSLLTLICWLKKKQMCTFPTFSDRNKAFCFFGGIMRDCKIILMLHISREKKFTKQNKELPSIPLCTQHIN